MSDPSKLPTPLTDAAATKSGRMQDWVDAEFARELERELGEARAALPPADKLRSLADWIDLKYTLDEVQRDLRAWADASDKTKEKP